MNRKSLVVATLLVLSLSLFLAGCVRGPTVETVDTFRLTDAVISSKESRYLGQPPTLRTSFRTTDDQVVMWLRFQNIRKTHTLMWRWYGPGTNLYFKTSSYTINPQGTYYETIIAWHKIAVAGEKASTLPGTWRVAVFLDNEFLTSKTFSIIFK